MGIAQSGVRCEDIAQSDEQSDPDIDGADEQSDPDIDVPVPGADTKPKT